LPVDNAERFAEFLLRDFDIDGETTMIAPADGFYATEGAGINEVRLAYVLETERLQRAMNVLVQALSVYPGAARAD
jgi:aspartate aminotransferase